MKSKKKVLVVILVVAIMALSTSIYIAKDSTVASIGNEKVSQPLYRICLWLTQIDFESLMPNIWNLDELYGKSPEEYAKDSALNSLKLSIAAKEKADELGVKLSNEDKKEIKLEAKAQMERHEAFAKEFDIKKKHFEEFLSYNKLLEKVIQKLGDNYAPNEEEVSKRIEKIKQSEEKVTVRQILIKNSDEHGDPLPKDKLEEKYTLAKEVLEEALNGEDFKVLMDTYSEDEALSEGKEEYTFAREEMEESFAKVAFELGEVGEVYPEIVETSYGYEIVEVLERHTLDEASVRDQAIQEEKTKFGKEELVSISETLKVEKKASYDDIHVIVQK